MKNQTVRRVAALVAALIGGYLLYLAANTASSPVTAFASLLGGLALFAIILFVLQRGYQPGADEVSDDEVPTREWTVARFLRRAKDAAPLFLGFRLFLGYEWFEAGLHKLQDPKWFQTGEALRAYWTRAAAVPEPPARPPISYPVYRSFIQFMLDNGWDSWFNYVIIFGELLIGIGLIVGGLTAIAAFFGILMNFTFLYAGSVSSNPTFIVLGVLIIIGWRVAGWWGLDRVLLPWLGTPWQAGRLRAQPMAVTQAESQRR
jgi:thiosulfate dehydrogenase [quinone] large subunit